VYLGVGQNPQAEALRVTVTVAIRNPTRIQLLVLSSCDANPGKEGTWAGPAAGGKLLVAVSIHHIIVYHGRAIAGCHQILRICKLYTFRFVEMNIRRDIFGGVTYFMTARS
jgi:hypothetical protein